ncbi:MAG: transcription antitermination factor NusB [Cellvibrionaceae bacterium]|nr:transcription antitermination factor NusB [Cellvibrionaceae bacterium]
MKISPATRRKARHYGMQALYQWQMTGTAPHIIEAEFRSDYDMTHVDSDYFHELLHKVSASADALDQQYQAYLQQRSLDELDPITQSLLRMATYEFLNRIDVPYKVVINEAVSLGKKFGANDSYKFINGVLDQLAPVLRSDETP